MKAGDNGHHITIVGGGLAGLYAAITAAESGAAVTLHESGRVLGGRARTAEGEWRANYGPHALYGDGPVIPWLRSKALLPELRRPPATGFRVRLDGKLQRAPLALVRGVLRLTSGAPQDISFGEWAKQRTSPAAAGAAAAFASLPTFHAYPERLSAAFVSRRLRRVTRNATSVRYVAGGWSSLVELLEAHASELAVSIHLGSHVSELPDPPVILATTASSASRLLRRDLPQTGTSVALLDIGLKDTNRRAPFAVLDLDERTYVARYSALDPGLAPKGHHLIQASAPLRDGETHAKASARLEHAVEAVWPAWSSDCRLRRTALATDATGAVDLPGRSWRDRPAIAQRDGVFIAGDYVAAPGLLSEVSWASAIEAAKLAVALQPARHATAARA
jgi:phytoene dehydrogenase-like protein